MNPKIIKLRREIEETNEKIDKLRSKAKELSAELMKLENEEIIGIVRKYRMTPEQLNGYLEGREVEENEED